MNSEHVTLWHGDCMQLLELLPSNSVDMVLCDLPYGTTACKWDIVLPLADLWREYRRVCCGAVVLFAQTPFDKVLGASNLADLRYEWIWEKSNATGFLNASRAPLKAHENILVFYRSAPVYNPQKTQGHARVSKATRKPGGGGIYRPDMGAVYRGGNTDRFPRSVLRQPNARYQGALHPTQKPLALCEYLIRTYTNPGDVVLDNTAGSGTTGVAAVNTGRRFVGMELDPHYFATARNRIAAALAQTTENAAAVEELLS